MEGDEDIIDAEGADGKLQYSYFCCRRVYKIRIDIAL